MGLSTKNVDKPTAGSSKTSKKLEPGNQLVEIVSVQLQKPTFKSAKPDEEYLMLVCEGPDLGPEFEGFLLDKDDPSKGSHKGQVGWVKASEWTFKDNEITKGPNMGAKISKDDEILKYIKSICVETGAEAWFDAQDSKHDTIQSFVAAFDAEKPYKGKLLRVCICGREYNNKAGYPQWDLYLPKFVKGTVPFENGSIDMSVSKVFKFDESKHTKRVAPAGSFTPDTRPANNDLEL